jgi:hypothetical protein
VVVCLAGTRGLLTMLECGTIVEGRRIHARRINLWLGRAGYMGSWRGRFLLPMMVAGGSDG